MKTFSSWGEVVQTIASIAGISVIFLSHGNSVFSWVALTVFCVGVVVSAGHLLIAFGLLDKYRINWQGKATVPIADPAVAVAPVSWGNLEIEDARQDKSLHWPLKIRLVLRNDAATSMDIGSIDWISHIDGAQLHVNADLGIGWYYQVEKFPDGSKTNSWQQETRQASVHPGGVFRLWVGLSTTHKWTDLNRMREQKKLGTIVLPVAANGKQFQATIRL